MAWLNAGEVQCDDFLLVNTSVDPLQLQVGQKIVLPDFKGATKGQAQYANISAEHGQEFVGEYLDEVEVEVEGVNFRVRRIGEPKIPHEIHLILPSAEIHKFQAKRRRRTLRNASYAK